MGTEAEMDAMVANRASAKAYATVPPRMGGQLYGYVIFIILVYKTTGQEEKYENPSSIGGWSEFCCLVRRKGWQLRSHARGAGHEQQPTGLLHLMVRVHSSLYNIKWVIPLGMTHLMGITNRFNRVP